jgi:pimeloyl-ACP methyl ester carboxylesterase
MKLLKIRWYKLALIAATGFVLLIIGGSHVLDGIMSYSDKDIHQFFIESGVNYDVNYLSTKDGQVRVIRSGQGDKEICVLFSHGAPGSWDAFKAYMTDSILLSEMDVISYDRPGYGGSYVSGSEPTLLQQALAIKSILDIFRYKKVFTVGHSFGGPIVIKHAIDYSDQVNGCILIAPAIDPATEKFFWFSGLAYWGWSRWMWPASFQVAGDEKFAHIDELKLLQKQMNEYNKRTLYIHGMEDAIAPADGNIKFVKMHIADTLLDIKTYPDKGHLIIWNDVELVRDLILDFIQ